MYFKEICQFISDQTGFTMQAGGGGILQPGVRRQNAPERCVLVAESGGGETNYYCPDQINMMIQVLTRARTYMQSRADSWTVFSALHGEAGWNMNRLEGSGDDYIAMTIEALNAPQYIGQDENGLFEFSTNYIFRCEVASCGV